MARLRSYRVVLLICSLSVVLLGVSLAAAQSSQETPTIEPAASPPVTAPAIPDRSASATQLEVQGDQLRAQKRFLDSIDFYDAAIAKQPTALLWNKKGMSYLLLQHPDKAAKCFDKAIKLDKSAPE